MPAHYHLNQCIQPALGLEEGFLRIRKLAIALGAITLAQY